MAGADTSGSGKRKDTRQSAAGGVPRYPDASDVNSGIRVGNFRQLRRAGTAGEGGAFRRDSRRIPVADPDGGKPAFDHTN